MMKPFLFFFTCTFAVLSGSAQTPELTVDKVLLNNSSAPWGFTFLNSDEVLFTEKQGKLFRYNISGNVLKEISGVPQVSASGQGGLLDVALHPDFDSNRLVYLSYAVNATGGQTTALGRGKLVDDQLQDFAELFRALPVRNSGQHFGSRIVFDRNHHIYMSVGDRGLPENAQNTNNHLGKVLRLNDDGTVPDDNPLRGVPDTKPEIFCWGNRNIQGMAVHPETGAIYAHEHGPRGGDELNLLRPGINYGWPAVTFGINYDGTPITPDTTLPGMELPLTYWVPSIAPSGMTFIRNGQASNEADILIGALAGTHIHWLKMKDDKRVASYRSLSGYARFRDVRQAPDGKIYALTESPNRFVLLKANIPILASTDAGFNSTAPELNITPNPTTAGAYLTFKLESQQNIQIRLLNAGGMLVRKITAQTFQSGMHNISIPVEDLPQGVYLAELSVGGQKHFVRLLKM